MSTKNNNSYSNNENKNHDVAGIICVIISAFFLICLITPLLSDIGIFVKNITTGLFGYMSYPISLCTLLYGILLLMNKKPKLTGKQIAFVVLMAICIILILQTILDTDKLNGAFGEYVSGLISVSAVGKSVGGVVFGSVVYLFKSILSFIGAYILYGLLFLLFAGLLIVDYRNNFGGVVRQNKAQPQQTKKEYVPFVKGKSVAQPVKDYNDTTLFVGTIERTNKVNTFSGDFSSINSAKPADTVHRYDEAPIKNNSFFGMDPHSVTPEQYEEDQRRIARNKLYGEPEEMRKSYDEFLKSNMNLKEHTSGRSNYLVEDEPIVDKTFHGASDSHSRGSSFKHEEKAKHDLPDVPVPPSKDVSNQFIIGPILNGEEVSKTIKDDTKWRSPNPQAVTEVEKTLPPIITGNPTYKKIDTVNNEALKKDNEVLDDVPELPPILNGDFYKTLNSESGLPYQEKSEKNDLSSSVDSSVANNDIKATEGESDSNDSDEVEIDDVALPQIIVADNFKKPENDSLTYQNSDVPQAPIITGSDNAYLDEPIIDEINSDATNGSNNLPNDLIIKDVEDFTKFKTEKIIDSDIVKQSDSIDFDLDFNHTVGDLNSDNKNLLASENVNDNLTVDLNKQQNDSSVELDEEAVVENSEQFNNVVNDNDLKQVETEEPEQIVAEAKIPDSLKLINDEIVDMSEKNDEVNDDNTGYYVRDDFNSNVDKISIKLNNVKMGMKPEGVNNQINMDDYDVVVPESVKPKKKKKHLRYNPPPVDLLINSSTPLDDGDDCEGKANILEECLHDLKIGARVISITRGPAVTRYELEMEGGQSVSKITGRGDDIAYALASDGKIRIEAPIRGKRAVGVEVPNKNIAIVSLREIIESKEFNDAKSALTLALGKGITGNIMTCNLEKMPHLLIAGTTGSGKSACLNSIIISILYKASPDDVRLILVDPKQVEFVLYRDMPHLLMKNIIKDSVQACNAFKWAREEMDKRYALFAQYSVRNISDYNALEIVKSGLEPKMPRIVIIVDELSELMLAKNSKELEENIKSLAQKARAAGVHLILATQRPSVDVITGTIKANFPSRIAFAVKSIPDSRTILDQIGAEALLGRGDMLYSPIDANDPIRLQGAFITTEEIENIVNFVRENNDTDYDEAAENIIMKKPEEEIASTTEDEKGGEAAEDPLMKDVLRRVIETKMASASQIQRRFSVGYNRASRIIDQMEEKGYVGPMDGSRPREVFITGEKFREIYGEDL